MNITERQELEAHRAYLRAGATLSNIRQRLELLEAPRPTAQQRQQADQRERINRFWQLTEEKMDSDANLSAQEARRLVLCEHPELKNVYPKIQ